MKPRRIQRKRTKGWRMPKNCVYVGRPTRWGNPFRGPGAAQAYYNWLQTGWRTVIGVVKSRGKYLEVELDGQDAVKMPYAKELRKQLRELRGKHLACWCKAGEACHADVLLELANR